MEPLQPLLAAGEELERRAPNVRWRSSRKLRASSVRTSCVSIIAASSHFGGEGQVERGRDSIGMCFGEDEWRPDLDDVLSGPGRADEDALPAEVVGDAPADRLLPGASLSSSTPTKSPGPRTCRITGCEDATSVRRARR